ncbi:MAG: hypothetical protein WED34_19225 [Planctomycetales bacterium]
MPWRKLLVGTFFLLLCGAGAGGGWWYYVWNRDHTIPAELAHTWQPDSQDERRMTLHVTVANGGQEALLLVIPAVGEAVKSLTAVASPVPDEVGVPLVAGPERGAAQPVRCRLVAEIGEGETWSPLLAVPDANAAESEGILPNASRRVGFSVSPPIAGAPPSTVRLTLSDPDGIRAAIERTIELPEALRTAWADHVEKTAKFAQAMKEGQAAMQRQDYKAAEAGFSRAVDFAVHILDEQTGERRKSAGESRDEARGAIAEGQTLDGAEQQLAAFRAAVDEQSAKRNAARQQADAGQFVEAEASTRKLLGEALEAPEVPQARWAADRENKLSRDRDEAAKQLAEIRNSAAKLNAEARSKLVEQHGARAATAYADFDFATAYREAGEGLKWSPDDTICATTHEWAGRALRHGTVFAAAEGSAACLLAFTDGETRLLTVHKNGTLRQWDVASKKKVDPPRSLGRTIAEARLSPDGARLATGGPSGVELHELGRAAEPQRLGGSREPFAFTPDGGTLAVGGAAQWNLTTGRKTGRFFRMDAKLLGLDPATNVAATALHYGPDGKSLLVGGSSGLVAFWDLAEKTVPGRVGESTISRIVWSPDHKTLVLLSEAGEAVLADFNGVPKMRKAIAQQVTCCAYSPDGATLHTGHADGRIVSWRAGAGLQETALQTGTTGVTAIAVDSAGRMAYGTAEGSLFLLDRRQRVETLPPSPEPVPPPALAAAVPSRAAVKPSPFEPVDRAAPQAARSAFVEDFRSVADGNLPPGWEGSNEVGVRTGPSSRWLQSSVRGEFSVRTPPLTFPRDFELELDLWFNGGSLTVSLVAEKGPQLDFVLNKWGGSLDKVQFSGIDLDESWQRVRLVDRDDVVRLILGTQQLASVRIPGHSKEFSHIRFAFDGDAKGLSLGRVALLPHVASRPQPAFVPVSEDFSRTPAGQLPVGWSSLDSVGVVRQAGDSYVEASRRGRHLFRSPNIVFPDDFRLDLEVGLGDWSASWQFKVSLEGQGDSPDLEVNVRRDWGGNSWSVGMTGVAGQTVRRDRHDRVPISIEREGATNTFRVKIAEQVVLAQRKAQHYDFRSIAFTVSGDDNVRLHGVKLDRLNTGQAAAKESGAFPNVAFDAFPDAGADRPGANRAPAANATDISGLWKSSRDGRVERITMNGETATLTVVEGKNLVRASGTVTRDGNSFTGQIQFIAANDPTKTLRTANVRITVVDKDQLRRTADLINWDRNGRETSRTPTTSTWRRIEE